MDHPHLNSTMSNVTPTADALSATLAALDRRAYHRALDELLRAFAARRAAPLIELIEAVSARLPVVPAVRTPRGLGRFMRIEGLQRPADVPSQLAGHEVVGGLPALSKRPPDPRIAAELLATLAKLPQKSLAAKSYYEPLFEGVVRMRDPRSLARLRALRPKLAGFGVAAMRQWMQQQLEDAIAALEAVPPDTLTPEEAALAARLSAVLIDEHALKDRGGRDLRALEDEVYEHPEDDRPRVRLADRLLDATDPRGELIALQLRIGDDEPTRVERARVNVIVRDHRERILGPLAPWLCVEGLVFERGFPARGRVRAELAPRGALPAREWATFVELDLANEHRFAELICGPLRGLRKMSGAPTSIIDALERCTEPCALTHIGFQDRVRNELPSFEQLERLAALIAPGRALANLRSLTVWVSQRDQARFVEMVGPQLERCPLEVLRIELTDVACGGALLRKELAAQTVEIAGHVGVAVFAARRDGAAEAHQRAVTIEIDEARWGVADGMVALAAALPWSSVAVTGRAADAVRARLRPS
jgi:hypothetical protein